jgi:hypothetical protein
MEVSMSFKDRIRSVRIVAKRRGLGKGFIPAHVSSETPRWLDAAERALGMKPKSQPVTSPLPVTG